ncbi:hypothetical protein L202_00245 [Cryptococcus amylolentus CBS 6039]|uniref:Major facilitator superfamily (MFS) profile domain-containing protein n=1 Tax=Cryptococcus amylolentus CBS 6039 TaxID=1295533 RepID=A0A1E3I8T4_9TREE|nr:hypothetical protein L202_00245 [Cryptococcus amylolentus CBS 6039]ODN84256.1 hypothetical protein L202_00245 [Cryptococcus amylolentus CBS 6039]
MSSPVVMWQSIPNAVDVTPWPKNRGLFQLFYYFSILCVGELLIGYDGTITGSLQALPEWKADLGNPDASKIGLLNAAAFIVGICMGPINSWVVDRFGRKLPIQWFSMTMIVGTIIGCIAGAKGGQTGYALFVASRAVIGAGIPPFLMTALILNQELSHPRYRALCSALWDCDFILGSTIASLVTFGTSHITGSWSWRVPYILQLLPATYMLVAVHFMPESPRWLVANGREEEAFEFFVKYHGNGDPNDELVAFEWQEVKETIALEEANRRRSWAEVLRMPGNKHRLCLAALMTFMPQMSGSNIISYYYSVVLTQSGISGAGKITGIGAGLNMWGFVCQVGGVWALHSCRRRTMVLSVWPLLMIGMAAMAASNGVFQVSDQSNHAAGVASVVMVWLYNGPANFISPLFYSYPAEILSYSIRGKGMAVWNTVNQAWGAYGSYVNSIALANIGWKYYCVFIPILAVQWVAAYFLMVETRLLTLEEIAIAFEGADAAVAVVDERLRGSDDNKSQLAADDEKKIVSEGSGNVVISEV